MTAVVVMILASLGVLLLCALLGALLGYLEDKIDHRK